MSLFAIPAALRAWHDAGRYFAYKGYSIYSRVDGPVGAPALLLIHGFPTASWDWSGVWTALAQRYRQEELLRQRTAVSPSRFLVMPQH